MTSANDERAARAECGWCGHELRQHPDGPCQVRILDLPRKIVYPCNCEQYEGPAVDTLFDPDDGRVEYQRPTVGEPPRRLPYVRDSVTSELAARSAAPASRIAREKVFAFIAEHGPVCDREIQHGLAMDGSTERPRRIELAAAGRIVKADVVMFQGRAQQRWQAV